MNNLNDIYINTLKSISQFTSYDKCWIIGSGALLLLSQGYPGDNYKRFMNSENFKRRDLDIVIADDYDIVHKLMKIGSITEIKTTDMSYKSLMFRSRMISKITTYDFVLGNTSTTSGMVIKNLVNDINVNFTIDVIELIGDNIKPILSEWPISETKRNFGVYYHNRTIQYTELVKVTHRCKNLTDTTLCNTIESLKTLMHHYGSNMMGYTQTGDKVNRKTFDTAYLKSGDIVLGKQHRLYDVLNGNSVELAKYINIPLYMYDDLALEDKAEKTCVICCTDIKDVGNMLIHLKCNHVYCAGCIIPLWISYLIMRYNRINNLSEKGDDDVKSNNQCPLCKKEMFKIFDQKIEYNMDLLVEDYRIHFMNLDIPRRVLSNH